MLIKLLNVFLTTINLHPLHSYGINPQEVAVSWYDTGSITATGESFNPDLLTFASPDLPFGTKLTIRHGKTIIKIRGNDRGPFAVNEEGKVIYPLQAHPTRKLDLSRGAYLALFGELDSGVGTIEIIEVEFP